MTDIAMLRSKVADAELRVKLAQEQLNGDKDELYRAMETLRLWKEELYNVESVTKEHVHDTRQLLKG